MRHLPPSSIPSSLPFSSSPLETDLLGTFPVPPRLTLTFPFSRTLLSNEYLSRCNSPFSSCPPEFFYLSPMGELVHGRGVSPETATSILWRSKPQAEEGNYAMEVTRRFGRRTSGTVAVYRLVELPPLVEGNRIKNFFKVTYRKLVRKKERKVVWKKGFGKLKELQPWPLKP
ncbi:hypothetical protein TeGR_g380 [Tetraparma gracilis]|uniref:Uncharacterized protein n=1 Tax=Tetraparma gracilis TaxID=2962635 RepID=A0ABQ6MKX4_9STRA|nr:hypothetical protein TeGR_g380 [Tetraparma gracilis]